MTIVALAAAIVCGCAPAPPRTQAAQTRVDYRANIAPGAHRYEEREDEVSTQPRAIENPPPLYPVSAIGLHLPRVEVGAKVIVDGEGRVAEVRVDPPASGAEPRPEAFDAAVRDAAMRWRFTPLTFTRWQDVEDAQGNVVDSRPVERENRPFSLDYTFSFELREGKPVTGVALPTAARRD